MQIAGDIVLSRIVEDLIKLIRRRYHSHMRSFLPVAFSIIFLCIDDLSGGAIFRRRIFTDSGSSAAQTVEEPFICTSHNCGLYWKVKIMVETGSELPSQIGIGHWKSGSNEVSGAKSDLAVKPSGRSLPDTDDPHVFREARAAFISGGVRLFGVGKSDICRHLQKMDESVLPLSKVPIRV